MALVQTAHAKTNGASLSVTFTNNIGAGNAVIVCLEGTVVSALGDTGTYYATLAPSSGGDTFTRNVYDTYDYTNSIWSVRSSAGGYKTVTVTLHGGSNNVGVSGWIYEVSSLTALDQTVTRADTVGGGPYATFNSGTTGTTSQADEFVVGVGGGISNSSSAAAAGPSSGGWTNLTAQTCENTTNIQYYAGVSGYQSVSSTGTFTYSGTLTGSCVADAGCVATFTGAITPALADVGAAADAITANLTSIPPAITAAPPRPAGPPPAPIPPQVLLVPSGTATQQDAAAAADVIAVTAETIPLADVGGAADYSSSQIFTADQGAGADAIAVTATLSLTDATGGATDLAGNEGDAEVNWAETGAALDKAGSAGLSEPDMAGAADAIAVAATGIAFTDSAGASDMYGSAAAIGASGGASVPQAYPGTSQVAVAAPGSSVWSYLGSLGNVTALTYSFNCPGGCDQMTCTVMVPASYRTSLFNPGWQVQVFRGGHRVWYGKLDEPQPTAQGWNITATGAGNLGQDYVATYTSTWPAGEPDQAINNAISRGLPWVNPGVGTPAGAWYGQAVDSGAQTVTALLNLVCTRGGLTWYVNSQPGGMPGNSLSVFPLPTTPNRLLVCTTPVARTLGGDTNAIFLRYEISADSTDSSGNATPATYGLVEVTNSVSVAQHGEMETYIDVSDAGVMTAAQAEQIGEYVLEVYQRASFAGPFSVHYGQLLNAGGQPVDIGTDQAGTVCRAIFTDLGLGGELAPGPISFIVGAYSYDDFQQVATVTPYNTLNQSLSSLLSLENTLLTPIQAASG